MAVQTNSVEMGGQAGLAGPMATAAPGLGTGTPRPGRLGIAERRARLVVRCACELLGLDVARIDSRDLHVPLSVAEFELILRERFGTSHPDLIFRTDSTLERARLTRGRFPGLPRVVLRRGAPPR
jgi:hypothetical protein